MPHNPFTYTRRYIYNSVYHKVVKLNHKYMDDLGKLPYEFQENGDLVVNLKTLTLERARELLSDFEELNKFLEIKFERTDKKAE